MKTLRVGYAFGRHVGNPGVCLVQALVGCTIADMMSSQVETFCQQPNAPNLYWALATLPQPIVNFRNASEGEAASVYLSIVPDFRNLDEKELSPAEWQRIFDRLMDCAVMASDATTNHAAQRKKLVELALAGSNKAKADLIAQGLAAKKVEAMSPMQAASIHTLRIYDKMSQDQLKWMLLPYPQAVAGMTRTEQKIQDLKKSGREVIPLVTTLLPAATAAKTAETRVERHIAALTALESIDCTAHRTTANCRTS